MKPKVKKGDIRYPISKGYTFLSAATATLSIVLALLILKDYSPINFNLNSVVVSIPPLLLYFIVTAIFSIGVFIFKFLFFSKERTESIESAGVMRENTGKRKLNWGLIAVLCLLFASFFLPAILATVLDPMSWFMSISGFVSGVGIEEVLFYLYMRKEGRT